MASFQSYLYRMPGDPELPRPEDLMNVPTEEANPEGPPPWEPPPLPIGEIPGEPPYSFSDYLPPYLNQPEGDYTPTADRYGGPPPWEPPPLSQGSAPLAAPAATAPPPPWAANLLPNDQPLPQVGGMPYFPPPPEPPQYGQSPQQADLFSPQQVAQPQPPIMPFNLYDTGQRQNGVRVLRSGRR